MYVYIINLGENSKIVKGDFLDNFHLTKCKLIFSYFFKDASVKTYITRGKDVFGDALAKNEES